jgi:hypothetical protein
MQDFIPECAPHLSKNFAVYSSLLGRWKEATLSCAIIALTKSGEMRRFGRVPPLKQTRRGLPVRDRPSPAPPLTKDLINDSHLLHVCLDCVATLRMVCTKRAKSPHAKLQGGIPFLNPSCLACTQSVFFSCLKHASKALPACTNNNCTSYCLFV